MLLEHNSPIWNPKPKNMSAYCLTTITGSNQICYLRYPHGINVSQTMRQEIAFVVYDIVQDMQWVAYSYFKCKTKFQPKFLSVKHGLWSIMLAHLWVYLFLCRLICNTKGSISISINIAGYHPRLNTHHTVNMHLFTAIFHTY